MLLTKPCHALSENLACNLDGRGGPLTPRRARLDATLSYFDHDGYLCTVRARVTEALTGEDVDDGRVSHVKTDFRQLSVGSREDGVLIDECLRLPEPIQIGVRRTGRSAFCNARWIPCIRGLTTLSVT